MSVINQMLKDLDKRQQVVVKEQSAPIAVQFQDSASGRSRLIALSVVSVLVGATAVAGFQYWTEHRSPQTAASVVKENVVLPAKPQRVEANNVNESINSDDGMTSNQATFAGMATTPAVPAPSDARTITKVDAEAHLPSRTIPAGPATETLTQQVSTRSDVAASRNDAGALPLSHQRVTPPNHQSDNRVQTPTAVPAAVTALVLPAANMAVKEVKLSAAELSQKSAKQAEQAEQNGQLDDAIYSYQQALQLDSGNDSSRKQLAALYYGRNQLPQAAALLKEGVALFPAKQEFGLLLARIQQASGDFQNAIISLESIDDTGPHARQKWLQQTDLAQKVGSNELSEQAYRHLVRVEPGQGRWWMGLAYALDSQKKYPGAREAYRIALSKVGLSAQATEYIQSRLVQLGDDA